MTERSFRQDLTGSEESLDDLLARLKAELSQPRPKSRPRNGGPRWRPPDAGHYVTNRGPRGGSGGAEAPLPVERASPDCCGAPA